MQCIGTTILGLNFRNISTVSKKLGANRVEYLIGCEGNAFAFTGRVEEDLLSIAAVHPMRKEAVKEFLRKAYPDWNVIEELLREGKIVEVEYDACNINYMLLFSILVSYSFSGFSSGFFITRLVEIRTGF